MCLYGTLCPATESSKPQKDKTLLPVIVQTKDKILSGGRLYGWSRTMKLTSGNYTISRSQEQRSRCFLGRFFLRCSRIARVAILKGIPTFSRRCQLSREDR